MDFSVPQGSVLGPKAYCMYTKPVCDIIRRHGLMHHSYADDTQIYITIKPSTDNWLGAVANIESFVVKSWMERNMLKLNDDKTELIVYTPKNRQHLCKDVSVTIGDSIVTPKAHVKNLGCYFRSISINEKTYKLCIQDLSLPPQEHQPDPAIPNRRGMQDHGPGPCNI